MNAALSYFISPDSVAAGVSGDSNSGVAAINQQQESRRSHMLTVAFNEPQFLASLSKENAGIGDEITGLQSDDESKQWKPPTSQALDRYSYVFNNPVRYTDPTGYCPWCIGAVIGGVVGAGAYALTCGSNCNWGDAAKSAAVGAITGGTLGLGSAGFAGTAIGSAVIGGGSDLAIQLIQNGGNAGAISWGEAGLSAGLGAVGGIVGSKVGSWVRSVRGAQEPTFFNRNLRIAPFGNATDHPIGRWPHYHRRGPTLPNGETAPGQGIGRHRPWQSSHEDRHWWHRF